MKLNKIAALFAVAGLSAPAFATNGMNMEGYGPISTSMGGTSMAYENGTAAVINNPATLGFMASGTSRLDLAVGDLMPNVSSLGQESSAKNFYVPTFGYVRKDGKISWGLGVMAQGGIGSEYSNGQFWGTLQSFGAPVFGGLNATAQNSLKNMSEVGVGRIIFPVAYQVSDALNIGGSIDYVWAGMDVKWLVDGSHFQDLVGAAVGGKQIFGTASGSMVSTMLGIPGFGGIGYGYFDFERSGHFHQQAVGSGWAGNLGFTYKVSPQLTMGGVYHAKTNLSDLETPDGAASLTMAAAIFPAPGAFVQTLTGKATVHNFQWPETYGLGLSYKATPQWTVNADYKRINWASVFQSLKTTFDADGNAANGPFANKSLDVDYYHRWNNQNVLQLGAAYQYSDALTLRLGTNIANNPIPDQYVSPLFPVIIKDQYTMGFGYAFSKAASLDASYAYAPKVSVTNNWSAAGGSNQNISVGGQSWQVMYSLRF